MLPMFDIQDEYLGFIPDIYIIGLQEIVELNVKNILKKDRKMIETWSQYFNQALVMSNKKILMKNKQVMNEQ